MSTYSSIQSRVSRRVIDLPSAVVAEVPQLVNVALSKLQKKHNFRVMEAELAAFTAVGSHSIVQSVSGPPIILPSAPAINFKEWRNEPWSIRYTDGSPRFMSWAPSREAIWGSFNQGGAIASDSSFPQLLLEEPASDQYNNRLISVYPIPDGLSDYPDGEYRITIPYYQYLPTLVSAGDHNWLTDDESGEEYIVAWAAGKAFELNWDFQKFQVFLAEAETHYKDVVNADKRFRLSSVREWVPHWRGVHSSKTRM